jgi:hypothetical protein
MTERTEQQFWDETFFTLLISDGKMSIKDAARFATGALELRRQRTLKPGDHMELVTS